MLNSTSTSSISTSSTSNESGARAPSCLIFEPSDQQQQHHLHHLQLQLNNINKRPKKNDNNKGSLLSRARNSTMNLASLANMSQRFKSSASVGNLWSWQHEQRRELAELSGETDAVKPLEYVPNAHFDEAPCFFLEDSYCNHNNSNNISTCSSSSSSKQPESPLSLPAVNYASNSMRTSRNNSSSSSTTNTVNSYLHHMPTSAWTNPQNHLATWIDNEVNSFFQDLEAARQLARSEKQAKSSGKRKWLSSSSSRRNSSGAHST